MSNDNNNSDQPTLYLRWQSSWGPPPKEVREAWTNKYRGISAIGIETPFEPDNPDELNNI